jgi:hypothetical protein
MRPGSKERAFFYNEASPTICEQMQSIFEVRAFMIQSPPTSCILKTATLRIKLWGALKVQTEQITVLYGGKGIMEMTVSIV